MMPDFVVILPAISDQALALGAQGEMKLLAPAG
jgi:hypothetical protein